MENDKPPIAAPHKVMRHHTERMAQPSIQPQKCQ